MSQDTQACEDENSEPIEGRTEVKSSPPPPQNRLSADSSFGVRDEKSCQVGEQRQRRGFPINDRHPYPLDDTSLHRDYYHKNTDFKGAPRRRSPTPDFKDDGRQRQYNKRKSEDGLDNPAVKTQHMEKECTNLVVLSLSWKSTEDDLRRYFSRFGDLLMVQIKKDLLSGQSKGFGFIRFQEYESQEKCLNARHMINGRLCHVRIPDSRERSQSNKVFVDRCTEDMTEDDLTNYFSKYGEVIDVYIPIKPFKAFAFVTFSDADAAQDVCDKYHTVKNVSVHVSTALPKSADKYKDSGNSERRSQHQDNKRKSEDGLDNPAVKTKRMERECTDLIVLSLPWKSTEDDLRYYFSQFGDLVMAQVKKDLLSGQSKGFGFIRFREYESQEKCLSLRHMINGRWCEVRIPDSKERSQGNKVFVDRITEEMTEDDLLSYFSKYGEVIDVYIPVKPFKAFAFVTFSDPDPVHNVCDKYHSVKNVSVHVSTALPKSVDNQNLIAADSEYNQHQRHYLSTFHRGSAWNPGQRGRNRFVNGPPTTFANRYSKHCAITRASDY